MAFINMSDSAIDLLLLIIAANSIPVLVTRLIGNHFDTPVDNNFILSDGRPLFGKSKTWRGVVSAILFCSLLAPALGQSIGIGASVGVLAMLGDLISSFIKRRRGLVSSSQAPLLDQIPEALLPALMLKQTLSIHWLDVILVPIVFLVLEVVFSIIFYKFGIRKTPY